MRWLALLVAVAGCSGSASRMEGDLRDLRQKVDELARANAGARSKVEDMEGKLLLLQDEIETQKMRAMRAGQTAAPVPALPVVKVAPPADDADDEGSSATQPQSGPGFAKIESVYQDVDEQGRVVGGNKAGKASPAGRRPSSAKDEPSRRLPKVPKAVPAADDSAVLAEYHASHDLYRQGRLDEARQAFDAFALKYPVHPYADNARYWVGECLYDRGEWDGARREFMRVVTEHPDGNKVPDAMVKVGLCDEKLRQYDEARRMFDAVMLTYPDSPAAAVAMKLAGEMP